MLFLAHFCALVLGAQSEVEPVVVSVSKAEPWVGERVPILVELRAPGSFDGSASFDLPQIPGALLVKIGSPTVSSRTIDGEEWFVQTHEFALFSQRSGALEVPAFSVRFSRREGFTGPVTEVRAETSATGIDVRRPPGSEQIGFLVTTESLEIFDSWDPNPGPSEVGAVFKRTIVQRSPNVPGMALVPAPTGTPEGIRAYSGTPETKDELARGEFLGERSETITYLMQEPGTYELPALEYVWWNPRTETLESETLPAQTFEVAPSSFASVDVAREGGAAPWRWGLAALVPVVLGFLLRRRLWILILRGWTTLNSPARRARRSLLRACREDDATAAGRAWAVWRVAQPASYEAARDLHQAVTDLQRHLFGQESPDTWRGAMLARAFKEQASASQSRALRDAAPSLPPLNPGA